MRRLLLVLLAAVVLISQVGAMFDARRADRAVAFFEHLKHTKGKFYGEPFVLLPWERDIVRDVYGTVNDQGLRTFRTVWVEIPKKNGKSELAAGAGLFHTFADGERNGEVYGCAVDKSQASIVFDVAVDMIDQLPALKKRAKLNLSTRTVTDKVTGTFYKVVSADAFSKHGYNISAVIFDEIHAQPNRALWDVMTFGTGAARAQPIYWSITTAGDDPDRVSIGWELHEYALKVLAGEILDPRFYAVVFGYDGDDIYNMENIAKANPSLGVSISDEALNDEIAKAQQSKANERLYRWLRLNQWLTSKLTSWLPLELWDTTVGTWNRAEQVDRECYIGLDLSTTTDLSAISLVFPPQDVQLDWRVMWETWIPADNMAERVNQDHVPYNQWADGGWVTPTEGNVIDYTAIRNRILELAKVYRVREVVADPAFATMLLQELQQAGLTVVTVPQNYANLTDPMNQVEVLLKEKKLSHEASPVARWAFGNTSIATNGQGLIKFVKEHRGKSVVRTKRIDPVAAWITAMCRARFYTGSIDLSQAILNDDYGM